MSSHYRLSLITVLAFVLVAMSGRSQAQAARHLTGAPDEVATLHKAYSALRSADHDYKGHRVKAMHAIEEACKALGAKAEGDGKGKEPQGESDSQLKAAQQLLESINPATTKSKSKAAKHISKAISELNEALAIK